MKEPIATITNIAFFIPAIIAESTLISVSFILLAFGSAMYHATDEWIAQKADEIAMYLVFWAMITIGAGLPLAGLWTIALTAIMGVLHKHFDSFQTIPLLFVFMMITWWGHPMWWWSLGGFILASGLSAYGRRRDLEWPHSLWHCISALSFTLLLL